LDLFYRCKQVLDRRVHYHILDRRRLFCLYDTKSQKYEKCLLLCSLDCFGIVFATKLVLLTHSKRKQKKVS
jgi:hypothetical protein